MASVQTTIELTLDALAQEASRDFASTMQTWEHHASEPIVTRSTGRRTVYVNNPIYFFLNNGTRIRRAFLSRDHRNKTTPRVIGSQAGKAGRVLRILPVEEAFPGITARAWDEEIAKKYQALIQSRFDASMQIIARELFK